MLSKEQSYLIFWHFAIYVWFLLLFRFMSSKGFFICYASPTFKSKVSFGYVGVVVNYTRKKVM